MASLEDLPERYQAKIRLTGHCWCWQGEINNRGYGRVWYKGYRYLAHRFIFWLFEPTFKIDDRTKEIDHLCENRYCVNPKHLEVITRKGNMTRVKRRRKRINRHGNITTGARK